MKNLAIGFSILGYLLVPAFAQSAAAKTKLDCAVKNKQGGTIESFLLIGSEDQTHPSEKNYTVEEVQQDGKTFAKAPNIQSSGSLITSPPTFQLSAIGRFSSGGCFKSARRISATQLGKGQVLKFRFTESVKVQSSVRGCLGPHPLPFQSKDMTCQKLE